MRSVPVFLLLSLPPSLLPARPALAQPHLAALAPTRNQPAAPRAGAVALTFDQAILPAAADVAVNALPQDLAMGIIAADGGLDPLTTSHPDSLGVVYVHFNDGAGSLMVPATGTATPVGPEPWGVALADLDGDHDVVTNSFSVAASGGASIRLNLSPSTPTGTAALVAERAPLTAYPNPTRDRLTWVMGAEATGAVEQLDGTGRVVRSCPLPATGSPQPRPLNLRGLPAGVYAVRSGGQVRRLVIE